MKLVIVLRFILVGFNEYFLTMLLLESTTPNLQFVGILVLKLCQKSYKTHPGCRSLINAFWVAVGGRLKLPRCVQAYMAVFGYDHTEVKDKTLLLSHLSSLICSCSLAAAVLADVAFHPVPSVGIVREQTLLLLILVFLSESIMLCFHERFGWLSTLLVPSWSRDLPQWKPDLQWWASFLTPWRLMVWLASLGLCIARSHEELLTRLSGRSDVPG
ncbi:hypothetical protein AK812_SmicGene26025 [Symbiodinium microadriaticum]|uniref:Uncharacterized protein n=1 Tax=Symbiodinium microadriaticum TaxID=2951 RepID=A0A1Q9DAP1_SYMMI|nr:hypothetical protein AK812_SmicGene26025 [Symbiodinium microadriaticum]